MIRRPPRSTRTDTLFPYTPLVRSYVSAQAEKGYRAAVSLISRTSQYHADSSRARFDPAHLRGLAPAGRLDNDSQGMLVLTKDGRIARQLIGDEPGVDKVYLVRVQGRKIGRENVETPTTNAKRGSRHLHDKKHKTTR